MSVLACVHSDFTGGCNTVRLVKTVLILATLRTEALAGKPWFYSWHGHGLSRWLSGLRAG